MEQGHGGAEFRQRIAQRVAFIWRGGLSFTHDAEPCRDLDEQGILDGAWQGRRASLLLGRHQVAEVAERVGQGLFLR